MSALYLARVEEDVSCPLCLELFVDPNTPKQLTCPHVYCQICLEKMVEGGLRVISCPECRRITKVPPKTPTSDGGISDLKTVIRLRSLAENHLKHTEKHGVSPSNETSGSAKQSSVPICPEHDDEKMHFYCVTCKVLACQVCMLLDHEIRTHEIKGVKVVYKEKLAEMRKTVKMANDDTQRNDDILINVTKQEEKIKVARAITEQEIDKAVAQVVAEATEQGKILKENLHGVSQRQLKMYQTQKQKLNYDTKALCSITAEAESTMENASPYEYLRKHDSLEDRIKKIHVDGQGKRTETIEGAKVFKMVPTPSGQLGELVCIKNINQIQTIGLGNTGLSYVGEMNIGGMIGTLAVCNRSTTGQRCVSVYHKQESGKYGHRLNLNVNGCCVAVAASGKILIATVDSVQVYKPSGQCEHTFYTTKDKDTKGVEIISITSLSDNRIVIGDGGRKVLTVHMPDGELLKRIYVGFWPSSITAMKDAQVALCNMEYGKIYVYDLDTGREVLRVDVPGVKCVCYDEETGSLMIANVVKEGIEQYHMSPWRLIKHFKEVTTHPWAMIFADKNELVVSVRADHFDAISKEIYVYRCTG